MKEMRKWRCDYRSFVNEHLWTIGKIYESDDDGYGMVCDNGNVMYSLSACEPVGSWCGFETTKFTEVFDEKEEVKMNKFKVGDVVEIIENCNQHGFKIGEKVELYKEYDFNPIMKTDTDFSQKDWMEL